jgi:hypothetical protein
VVVTQGYR